MQLQLANNTKKEIKRIYKGLSPKNRLPAQSKQVGIRPGLADLLLNAWYKGRTADCERYCDIAMYVGQREDGFRVLWGMFRPKKRVKRYNRRKKGGQDTAKKVDLVKKVTSTP